MQYHLLKSEGVWRFREAGSPDILFTAETKAEAMDKMQDYMESREGHVFVHKADGEIQQHRNFSEPESSSGGLSATAWSIIGVVAVAAITAASVVYYYRDSIPAGRLRLTR